MKDFQHGQTEELVTFLEYIFAFFFFFCLQLYSKPEWTTTPSILCGPEGEQNDFWALGVPAPHAVTFGPGITYVHRFGVIDRYSSVKP